MSYPPTPAGMPPSKADSNEGHLYAPRPSRDRVGDRTILAANRNVHSPSTAAPAPAHAAIVSPGTCLAMRLRLPQTGEPYRCRPALAEARRKGPRDGKAAEACGPCASPRVSGHPSAWPLRRRLCEQHRPSIRAPRVTARHQASRALDVRRYPWPGSNACFPLARGRRDDVRGWGNGERKPVTGVPSPRPLTKTPQTPHVHRAMVNIPRRG